VLLIGMMGVGKTTIGRALAARVGWRSFDSDAQVEARTGRTVPELFATGGEAAFRAEETAALAAAIDSREASVVSVAGGAVLSPDNRRMIRDGGLVVWLRAPIELLAERVGTGAGRPLLGDDPAAALARLYEQRRPLYHEVADVVIDVDGLDPADVVDRIIDALAAAGITVGAAR
jgi:shikimate kinase